MFDRVHAITQSSHEAKVQGVMDADRRFSTYIFVIS
jgi:hypothetical protein